MANKDIDKTIEKALQGYAQWCLNILQKQYERIQNKKFKTEQEYKNAVKEYNAARSAYDFLMKIVKEPKKYLYSGEKFFDAKLQNGDSLYRKILPLTTWPFDKNQKHLLVNLCNTIAHHVKFEKRFNNWKGVWEYYGDSAVMDLNAETIIKLNKSVQLWNANAFVAAIKDFAPPSAFAVNVSDNER